MLDHSFLVGKQIQKLLKQKLQNLQNPYTFVSAIFELVNFPTRYEWSKIMDTVQ